MAKNTTTTAPKTYTVKAEEPWTAVAIQLMGPFSVTNRSHKYIIIMIDLFTRWAVILPLHDTSAAEIAKAIVKVFFLYGPPQKMPIGQGKELVNQVSLYVVSLFSRKKKSVLNLNFRTFLKKTVNIFSSVKKKSIYRRTSQLFAVLTLIAAFPRVLLFE